MECPLSLGEKVTETVSPAGERLRGCGERFPTASRPGALGREDPQLRMEWWAMLGRDKTRVPTCFVCLPFYFSERRNCRNSSRRSLHSFLTRAVFKAVVRLISGRVCRLDPHLNHQ